MNAWRLIDSGEGDAFYNMAIDEAIAIAVMNGVVPPTLRFYGWKVPSVSLGHFQRIDDINLNYCIENNLPVVRRPTGGRAILHGDELTYSFSARNEDGFSGGLMESYSLIGNAFLEALRMLGLDAEMMQRRQKGSILTRSPLCFNSTSIGEISLRGIKLIGSAQRRWKGGFLQQGSIPYSIDLEKTIGVFRMMPESISLKGLGSFINIDIGSIKKAILKAFEKTFNISLVLSCLSHEEVFLAERLQREKYLLPEWNHSGLKGGFYSTFETPLMLNNNKQG
ncbi:MAG: biotin/lipoate A/B protein ligase family protein [Thermodesulfovibrionales bacterium]